MRTISNRRLSRVGKNTRPMRGHGAVRNASPLPGIKIDKILLPTDFSEPSKKALRYAKAFARQFGAQLVLLHVVEPVPYTADFGYGPVVRTQPDPRFLKRSQTHLRAIQQRQLCPECRCDSLVRGGFAFDEIAKAAKELKVDLIILATHGWTGLDHVLSGSTTERVVRHAPCPVLVIRENEHEFVR